MKTFLNNTLFLTLTFWTVIGHSQQTSSELMCRTKAKEIATQTYSGCVTEARNTQIDQIRKDYQKQLSELKTKYDRELKKATGKGLPTASKATPALTTASTGSKPKATSGIAKTLPTRKEVRNMAPPVTQEPTLTPDSTNPPAETEPTQNEPNEDFKVELSPSPASSEKTATTSDGQM
ncbi:MAG: hypothetical protein ACXVB1_01550 [Pseudobdellovibrionaceae bacterium]